MGIFSLIMDLNLTIRMQYC